MPYCAQCRAASLAYRSLMRWRHRVKNGLPVVAKAGPKKVVKPDMGQLQEAISNEVQHGDKRSFGVMTLYRRYQDQVSRREVQSLAALARRDERAEKLLRMRRIQWITPGLVLSMDDSEYDRNPDRSRLFLHNTADLGSRFCYPPEGNAGGVLDGERIAETLDLKFSRCGAPLFAKRDNGSNLNHQAVNEVLSKYLVLPLNNPAYYPPYNGVMERLQREIKAGLRARLSPYAQLAEWMLTEVAGNVVHDLNHKPRRVLAGQVACVVFDEREGGGYTLRQRAQIYELLTGLAADILSAMGETGRKSREAAWRMAAEMWLHQQGHITVTMGGKVLPYYFHFLCHN